MNVDTIARLIESLDVANMRTLSTHFLKIIGHKAFYCDGSYDGGKDFWATDDNLAIQISIEKDWRQKIDGDAKKIHVHYPTIKQLIFISSRRIPEDSFTTIQASIHHTYGINTIRYDSQSIASQLIASGTIDFLADLIGFAHTKSTRVYKKENLVKEEAVASLLLFSNQSRDIRNSLYDNIVLSYLYQAEWTQQTLLDELITKNIIAENQHRLIISAIDRLGQAKKITRDKGKLSLSVESKNLFQGLTQTVNIEEDEFEKKLIQCFSDNKVPIDNNDLNIVKNLILDLSSEILDNSITIKQNSLNQNTSYNLLSEKLLLLGSKDPNELFQNIISYIKEDAFMKKATVAHLYNRLINIDSTQLLNALGGYETISVYLDTSVFIPVLIGLIFESSTDRASYSGRLFAELIREHQFTVILPDVYIEEVAAHLIAAADYSNIIPDDKIPGSQNAFVSHYSFFYKDSKNLSFEEYLEIFGLDYSLVKSSFEHNEYMTLRNQVIDYVKQLIAKYDISVISTNYDGKVKIIQGEIEAILQAQQLNKPALLVEHDAKMINYLRTSGDTANGKILCTWDKIQGHPSLQRASYLVMTPIAIIDLFCLAKQNKDEYDLMHLIDFVKMQNEESLIKDSIVWDEIVNIEKGKMLDANLINRARKFKKEYWKLHDINEDNIPASIAKEWSVWRRSTSE